MSRSVDIGAATAARRGLYLAHPLKNHVIQSPSTTRSFPSGPLFFFFCLILEESSPERGPEEFAGANWGMEAVAVSSCLEDEELDELRRPPSPSSRAMSESVVVSGEAEVGRQTTWKNVKAEIKGGANDKQA